jgi:hypothetical protein
MRPWSSVGFVLSLACMAMWVPACGNEGGAPNGAGAAGAGGGTGFDAGLGPPTFETQFTSGDGFTSRWPPNGV